MLEYVTREVDAIENAVEPQASRADVIRRLRALSLSDFGHFLMTLPNPRYPKLSSLLPRMADDEVQRGWTGSAGLPLLTQTTDFVRALAYNYTRYTGQALEGRKVLDFGCGYGRIARLMYYFTDEERYYGVDPWDRSLQVCAEDGLRTNFLLSDYLPTALPVGAERFDLIFAFSVFTHLSERATRLSLDTLSRYLAPGGLLTITIRPVEYWDHHEYARKDGRVEAFKALHRERGFAFYPHNLAPVDGDVTYGDTSLTLAWLGSAFPSLRILGIDRSLSDPYQIYVFMQAR